MPRYVILFHETPADSPRGSHWDFMLEHGSSLRTWALAVEPRADSTIEAEALADHRSDYLTYEGPVSCDRGHVTQWDAGDYELVAEDECAVRVELRGGKLRGSVILSRTNSDDQRWMFLFRNK